MPARIVWTAEMRAALVEMRTREPASARLSVERCADAIGVAYSTALKAARAFGVSDRIRRGGRPRKARAG